MDTVRITALMTVPGNNVSVLVVEREIIQMSRSNLFLWWKWWKIEYALVSDLQPHCYLAF